MYLVPCHTNVAGIHKKLTLQHTSFPTNHSYSNQYNIQMYVMRKGTAICFFAWEIRLTVSKSMDSYLWSCIEQQFVPEYWLALVKRA